ncbi:MULTISPECIES: OmpP1/FadL family transporter [unclassified Anaeromyxobacter]|uniref:OmpP1/FadL family transporter n=1 Tax=unclassified Anaeromyxobacter TaxID=2620896 RepID=UPI001F599255|nr:MULTISPECIES: outer membrane protein transport protein [unclassified Anaeromyxobacter]
MTMKRLTVLLAAISTIAPAAAHATNGMRMIGFGAVQDAMGGVGVGATLDGASLLTNPAGIADLGRCFELGGSYFKPSVSYSATGSMPAMFVANDGASLDSDRGASPIPVIAYVQPVTDRISAGLGVFGVAGMGVDYATNLYYGPTLTSYMQGRFTPGASYRVSDRLTLGVTANVMVAQMKYDVASGAGQAAHDTSTAVGGGATFGVKFTPVKRVTLGAAYETRSWFQDFSFDVPARPNPMAPGTTIPGGTDKLSFDQPQSATLGVAVTPVDALLLAVDVQWIDWSSTMGDGLPQYTSDPSATGAMPFNMGWSDQWVVKVGAQVKPTAQLALRAGYNYGKMPLDPDRAFENMAFPAVSEHHLTAGVGYAIGQKLNVNVAGMYALNSKLEGSNAAPPPPMGNGQGIAAYSTEMSQLEIDVGLAYHF